MPRLADLVGRPIVIAPNRSSDCPIPTLADGQIRWLTLEIELEDGDDIKSQCTTPFTTYSRPMLILLWRNRVPVQLVKRLCPFCDQPLGPRVDSWFDGLPQTTLETLPNLIAALWVSTKRTPRPNNPQGRTLPGDDEQLEELRKTVCSQHRYESLIIPMSVQYNWPRDANFSDLLGSLFQEGIRDTIQRLYEYPWGGLVISNLRPTDTSRRFVDLLKLKPEDKDILEGAG